MFGPRKARCVDFIKQTYSKRYDFFDRFRSGGAFAEGEEGSNIDGLVVVGYLAAKLRLQELDKSKSFSPFRYAPWCFRNKI